MLAVAGVTEHQSDGFNKNEFMNFASERNKPIFVARPSSIALSNSRDIINEALVNMSADPAFRSTMIL
jgi:hypothetical protein